MDREEAIVVVRKNYPHVGFSGSEFETALRVLAPELAESEDEMIRKKIIQLVNNETGWQQEFPSQGQCLAYLEKQKEQNPGDKDRYIEGYMNGINDALKEQKPAEWSEEDEQIFNQLILRMDGHHYTYEVLQSMKRWLQGRMKLLRPWKPSEEQMQYLLAVINDPNNAGAESCHLTLESLYSELKKL